MNILEKTLELIFLPSCGVCGKIEKTYLCKECGKELEKHAINRVYNINNNIEMFSVFKYDDLIRKLILQYKFNDKSYLYKMFCEFLMNDKKILDFIKSYDIIIPVPMYKSKVRKRGYNQSELIAKELARKLGLIVYTDVLIKMKNNKVQSTLNQKERLENTKNVYKLINLEKINNKRVLIFDDIYTTGATINACIEEVKKANPEKTGVLTLAKD